MAYTTSGMSERPVGYPHLHTDRIQRLVVFIVSLSHHRHQAFAAVITDRTATNGRPRKPCKSVMSVVQRVARDMATSRGSSVPDMLDALKCE